VTQNELFPAGQPGHGRRRHGRFVDVHHHQLALGVGAEAREGCRAEPDEERDGRLQHLQQAGRQQRHIHVQPLERVQQRQKSVSLRTAPKDDPAVKARMYHSAQALHALCHQHDALLSAQAASSESRADSIPIPTLTYLEQQRR
jgi:hypothetical protein